MATLNHRQADHAVLPRPDHDENARQDFVVALRAFLTGEIQARLPALYEQRVKPALTTRLGREPDDSDDVRVGMTAEPLYQMWSALQRRSQELVWSSALDTIERTRAQLAEAIAGDQPLGSLSLDPDLAVPRYHTAYDIHLQPGGYHTEHGADDAVAGALYDLGVPIYGGGMLGPYNDAAALTLIAHYRDRQPGAAPGRILDLGCAIGNSTTPWKAAFPDAAVHGVDVAAPCLRYGHARANALGQSVHFHQQNAESLQFADGSFDVVTAALLLHETSRRALPRILAEARRVLRPGGVMLMMDGFRPDPAPPFNAFLQEWEIDNNNEHFLKTLIGLDLIAECESAGFASGAAGFEQARFITGNAAIDAADAGYMTGFNSIPLLVATA